MANQLQLRKGSASPIAAAAVITNALEAEPFFNTTDGGLYVAKATGSAGFAFIGGGDTIAPNTSSTGAELKLRDGGASDYISIRGASAMTATYSAVMPAAIGGQNTFLEIDSIVTDEVKEISALTAQGSGYTNGAATNVATTGGTGTGLTVDIIVVSNAVEAAYINNPGSGYTATDTITISTGGANATFTVDKVGNNAVLTWGSPAGGFSGFTVDDGTNSDSIVSNDALTIAGGDGITSTLDNSTATDPEFTIALDIDGLTDIGAALADADVIAIDDGGAGTNRKTAVTRVADYTFSKVSGDIAIAAGGVATIQADSVALGTDTTGNYVEDVTAGAGLTKSSVAGEGQTVDLAVGAGEGITVNADDVELKNATNLTGNTILKWDDGNTQLENSSITDDGTDVTVTGNANLIVTGNLTVNGNTTTVDSTTVTIDDLNLNVATNQTTKNTNINNAGIYVGDTNGDGSGTPLVTWVYQHSIVTGGAWVSSENLVLADDKDLFMANGTIQVLEDTGSSTQVTLRNTVIDGGSY